MPTECDRCGRGIGDDDVRYARRTPQGTDERFCSLNCLTDSSAHDEGAVRDRLFDAVPAE
jgi:hypothetical protein